MHDTGIGSAGKDAVPPPRLFALVREAIRRLHYSPRTEQTYIQWIRKLIDLTICGRISHRLP